MALALQKNANNTYDVGSFDAKTFFAELLRMVQNGATINITKNGKHVAVMQSPQKQNNSKALESHYKLMELSKKIAIRNKNAGHSPLSVDEINELKNDGRKW